MKKAILALVFAVALSQQSLAVDKYWDINGTTAGAGGAGGNNPTGAWNSTATNWNTDSTGGAGGAISAWTAATDRAIFSADTTATGAFTVTATGTPVAAGILIEEGSMTLAGRVDVNTGIVELRGGTFLSQASSGGATGTGITLTAGGKYAITGNATLQQTNGATGGSFVSSVGVIELSNNAALTIDYTTANALSIIQTATVISGSGSLIKNGVGVIAIASTSTYSGSTTINAGELRIRTTANRLPVATAVTINGPGILNLNGVSQQIGSLTGTGNVGTGAGTLTIDGATSTSFDGAVKNIANAGAAAVTTGNGRIVKNGAGVITFNGLNDINGSVTLNAGGITVSSTGSLSGDIADLTVNGGVLTMNNAAETVENLAGTGGQIALGMGHVLTTDPVASTTYSGQITGAGGLIKANALSGTRRTLTLSGNNSYDGNTVITGGLISVQHASALGSATGYTEVNATSVLGAEVLFTGAGASVTTFEPFRLSGAGSSNGGAISVIATANPTISGPVTLIGNTTLTVSSTSGVTYNNPTAITSASDQNLTLQGGSGAGAGGTISGAIALGAGSLTKNEGGKWVLSNAAGNTYSGGTIINSGTLLANNTSGSATGSGGITVVGGTFGGTGAVSGAVTVKTGGTLAPGASIESLDTGALTFEGGSNLNVEINSSVSLTAAADLLASSGGLSIDATANLNVSDVAATSVVLVNGVKLTLVKYDATAGWNMNAFSGKADDSVILVGANRFLINYNDTTGGVNFVDYSAGAIGALFVTLTAVPEASSMLFGALACCLAGAVWGVRRIRRGRNA